MHGEWKRGDVGIKSLKKCTSAECWEGCMEVWCRSGRVHKIMCGCYECRRAGAESVSGNFSYYYSNNLPVSPLTFLQKSNREGCKG